MHRKPKPEVKFGIKSLNRPTPSWAHIVFGIAVLVTTLLAGWVAGTNVMDDRAKFEWVLILKLIDPFLLGVSKLFGIDRNPSRNE
jgi:hypothetical protein